jgi:hypothetical protein
MNMQNLRFGSPQGLIVTLIVLAAGLPASARAQLSPFAIDGVIPDGSAVQFSDPYGSDAELGPVNSNATKLNSIGTATEPMLDFTNPNVATDLVNI